jgi:hypothetical protein
LQRFKEEDELDESESWRKRSFSVHTDLIESIAGPNNLNFVVYKTIQNETNLKQTEIDPNKICEESDYEQPSSPKPIFSRLKGESSQSVGGGQLPMNFVTNNIKQVYDKNLLHP